jgi:hypothetical protein
MSARHRHVKKKIRAAEEELKYKLGLRGSYADVITHISRKGFMSHATTLRDLAAHANGLDDECKRLRDAIYDLERTLAAMPKRLERAT